MKNIIGFAAVLVFCLSLFLLASKKYEKPAQNAPPTIVRHDDLVQKYNDKINKIYTFSADIETNNGVNAKLMYDKKNNQFQFVAFSGLGKEMDIGTNKDFFWFWSRRYDSKLYYSEKTNINKCNLKPQFNPNFLVKVIGIEPIKDVIQTNSGIIAFQELDKMVYVCNINQNPTNHILYNNNKAIAFARILSVQAVGEYIVPKQVELNFPEEKLLINWTFKNIQINTLGDNKWNVPDIKPKILIGS